MNLFGLPLYRSGEPERQPERGTGSPARTGTENRRPPLLEKPSPKLAGLKRDIFERASGGPPRFAGGSTSSTPPIKARPEEHPSPEAPVRLGELASSSSAAVRGAELADCSLEDVKASCDPHRLGLVRDNEVAITVEDPYLPGQSIQAGKALKDMIRVMSFDRAAQTDKGRGMNAAGVALATQVFSIALRQVAALSPHKAALQSVAAALKDSGQILVYRSLPTKVSEDEFEQNFTVRSRIQANDMADALQSQRVGEHAFHPIENSNFTRTSHMVGLSMSRIDGDTARVSLVNPVKETVGQFADVPISRVKEGLERFFSGEAFKRVCETFVTRSIPDLPTQTESSTIFTEWIRSLHPNKELSSAYFDGKPLQQTPQKGGSCTVESIFALMATTLPRDAYKLAKAACLSTVLAMGKATGVIRPAEQARIEQRVESAWRGIGTRPDEDKVRSRWA